MPPKKDKKAAFPPKSMVLAKMTGFPAWPLFVMPEEMIPTSIMGAKKKTTNLCVIFIPDGDFNWMNEKLLEALPPDKLQARLLKMPKDKLKSKAKKKAARTTNVAEALVAATGLDFDDFMEDLARQNKLQNDEDEENENEDENENEEHNENEEENEKDGGNENGVNEGTNDNDIGSSKPKIERRHRRRRGIAHSTLDEENADGKVDGIASDNSDDNADEPENGNDNNVSKNENGANEDHNDDAIDGNESENVSVDASEADTENNTRKRTRNPYTDSRKRVNGNENGDRVASPRPLSDKDRQHQLWLCRIKLQRSLIQRNQPATPKDPKQYPAPTVDELLVARIILNRLADFPVSVELLRETKIHKVLKCILKDEDLEYPDSFRLHEKCEELLLKWKDMIDSLKQEKQARYESRLTSQMPEDLEISGLETKSTLADHTEKVKV